MKKTIIVCLCATLIIVATVAGTVSALKAAEGSHFPIFSGVISVEILEEKRGAAGGFEPVTEKNTFLPDPSAVKDDPVFTVRSAVQWKDRSRLFFWNALPCAVDKIVTVKNTSKRDAYVRVIFALEDTGGISERIYLNVYRSELLAFIGSTEINGTAYKLYSYTYDKPLGAGETSAPSLLQFVCGGDVTASELLLIGDAYDILISAEAVQTAGFDDPEAALNAMFGEITALNHPWA